MADAELFSGREASIRDVAGTDSPVGPDLPPLPPKLEERGKLLADALNRGENIQQAFDSFCSAAYVKPEWAGAASDFLAALFEPHEDLLAEIARIPDLIIELATGHITMTCQVAARWAARGETARMARLAEALIATQSKMSGAEVVDVMLALATSLAINRHSRAEQLFALAEPLATDEQREALHETRLWLGAGRIVRSCPQEVRELWDQRLRRSRHAWTWESQAERDALLQLADQLEEGLEGSTLFRAVVPSCWWDLAMVHARERAEAQKTVPAVPPPVRPDPPPVTHHPYFADREFDTEPLAGRGAALPMLAGSALGVIATLVVVWFLSDRRPAPAPKETAAQVITAPAAITASQDTTADPVPATMGTLQQSTAAAEAPSEPDSDLAASQAAWRREQAELLGAESPELSLVVSSLQNGNWEDNQLLLRGHSPVLPHGSVQHQRVLRWLLLDPPENPETRSQVPLLYAETVGGSRLIELWRRLVYPGSSNAGDIQAAARELLRTRSAEWSEEEQQALQELAADPE